MYTVDCTHPDRTNMYNVELFGEDEPPQFARREDAEREVSRLQDSASRCEWGRLGAPTYFVKEVDE